MKASKSWVSLLALAIVLISLLITSVSAQTTEKPQRPVFTLKITDHSFDQPAVYETDQFTGQKTLVTAAWHYEWRTLDFTIQNQHSTQGDFYYNIRYQGQYATNWTYICYEGRYIKAEAGQTSTISYHISGEMPYTQTQLQFLYIPEGAIVDFEAQAFFGGMIRGSPEFSSGEVFTGEASEWSNAIRLTIDPITSMSPIITPSPTNNQQNAQTLNGDGFSFEQIAIVVLSIVVGLLTVALMLTLWRNVRKNVL